MEDSEESAIRQELRKYVTQRDLDASLFKLKNKVSSLELKLGGKHFLAYIGSSISALCSTAIVGSALVYGALSFAYGPYDAGKVIYSTLSGDKELKRIHVEEAKGLYARKILKPELDERDMKNMYMELGAVGTEENPANVENVSWYRLLDWIEAND